MRDILVSVDNTDECEKRLDIAQQIAGPFDAHVTGIHINNTLANRDLFDGTFDQLAMQTLQSQLIEERAHATELFYKAFRLGEGMVTFLSEFTVSAYYPLAKMADLIVVSQPGTNRHSTASWDFLEDMIMRSGRPVLIIPYAKDLGEIAQSILVAWDGTREATRAVHDALPLLKSAASVQVVSVTDAVPHKNTVQSSEIAAHLVRHRVNVIAHDMIDNKAPIAEILLSVSAEFGSDMIVMGGYGHCNLRQYVFGRVTRSMLDHMTLPVMMSH